MSKLHKPTARLVAAALLTFASGCTTVEPGGDFNIADVVYDENFYYCQVEPMIFANRCGPGDPGKGDSGGGCHFNVTTYRLRDYSPLVGETCNGIVPTQGPPAAAQGNYQTSQARMQLDPDLAPLLNYPTKQAVHPRKIFDANGPEADIIRQWATKFSNQ